MPDLTVAQNLRLAGVAASNRCAAGCASSASRGSICGAFIRDLPYPILRLIDLARALASEPEILLLDEITAALPADLSERVFAVVRQWRDSGQCGDLHLPPHGRGRGALRPRDGAARRRHRRRDRDVARQRGADRHA